MDKSLLQTILPVVVLLAVVSIRLWRMRGLTRLNPSTLWVRPALLLLVGAALLVSYPPGLEGLVVSVAAFVAGSLLGWKRGQMISITRNDRGELMQKASPAAMILLVAIIAFRFLLRSVMGGDPAQPLSGNALIVTDAMVLFMVGLVSVTALEIGLRARRMLAGKAVTN